MSLLERLGLDVEPTGKRGSGPDILIGADVEPTSARTLECSRV